MYKNDRHQLSKTLSKAKFYSELKQFKAARVLLENSIKEYGKTAHITNQLGLICFLESNFLEAIEYFKSSIKLNPKFVEAHYNLAATYCDLSMYDEAKAVEKQINSLSAELNKGIPSLNLGRIADQHIKTASLYKRSGLKIEALREYEKALNLFPSIYEAKIELAKLRIEIGQYEQAKQLLMKSINESPNDTDFYALLANTLIKQNKLEEAAEILNKSLHIDPQHRLSRSLLSAIGQ